MKSEHQFCLVMTTCPGSINAKQIAQNLVANHLAACVNVLPRVTSFFWWPNKVESSEEHLLLIKTTVENFKEVEKSLKKLHQYDVPEIIAIPIISGSDEYLKWIVDNTK